MRKKLFAETEDYFIEEEMNRRNARGKKTQHVKNELKRANKKLRNIGKNINKDYFEELEENID